MAEDFGPDKPVACLFTFPFVIHVDSRAQFEGREIAFQGGRARIYPLFRSAPANWIPMPKVAIRSVPFPSSFTVPTLRSGPEYFECLSVLPAPDGFSPSGVAIQAIAGDEGGPTSPTQPRKDSLRIDFVPGSTLRAAEQDLHTLANLLMANLRSITKQWWISRSSDVLVGWMRNQMAIDVSGAPLNVPEIMVSRGMSPSGFERTLDAKMWGKALDAISSNLEPPLYKELLLDSTYHLASKDYRRVVLDCAGACEMVKDALFERIWHTLHKGTFRKSRVFKGYDLPVHVDRDLKALCDLSFALADPSSYQEIENLWDARGNVAHGQRPYYRRDNISFELDNPKCAKLINASWIFCEWANELPK